MARKSKIDVKEIAMDALALSGGAAASGLVDGMLLSKISFASDPKIKALIKIGAGAFLPPMLAKGRAGGFIEKFGDGMIALGGYQLLHAVLPGQIPAIAGIDQNLLAYPPQVKVDGLPTVSGPLPTVSGIGESEKEGAENAFFE